MGIVNSVSLPNSQNMYFKVEAIEIRECASAALFTNNQGYLREKAALTKTRNRQDFVEQNRVRLLHWKHDLSVHLCEIDKIPWRKDTEKCD